MKHVLLHLIIVLCSFITSFGLHRIEPYDRQPLHPRVTIITSVYKSDVFMRGFLENIVEQTIFNECELLLINANSPGNEEPIIKEFMTQYPNITYIKLPEDPGLYSVWNIGLRLARSEYVTNANTDDRLIFNCYQLHAACLDANPEIDLVYSDFYTTSLANDTLDHVQNLKHSSRPEFSLKALGECIPGINPMWRLSMHHKHGFFNEDFFSAGDWEMWCRAAEGGSLFKKVNAITGLYYHNPQGLSSSHFYRDSIQKERRLIKLLYNDLFKYKSGKKRKLASTEERKKDKDVQTRKVGKRSLDSR